MIGYPKHFPTEALRNIIRFLHHDPTILTALVVHSCYDVLGYCFHTITNDDDNHAFLVPLLMRCPFPLNIAADHLEDWLKEQNSPQTSTIPTWLISLVLRVLEQVLDLQ